MAIRKRGQGIRCFSSSTRMRNHDRGSEHKSDSKLKTKAQVDSHVEVNLESELTPVLQTGFQRPATNIEDESNTPTVNEKPLELIDDESLLYPKAAGLRTLKSGKLTQRQPRAAIDINEPFAKQYSSLDPDQQSLNHLQTLTSSLEVDMALLRKNLQNLSQVNKKLRAQNDLLKSSASIPDNQVHQQIDFEQDSDVEQLKDHEHGGAVPGSTINQGNPSPMTRKEKSNKTVPHLNKSSEVHMISVTEKGITHRSATALGTMKIPIELARDIIQNNVKKGDVLSVARIAAIQAVKKTSELIPLCHSGLAIDGVSVDVDVIYDGQIQNGGSEDPGNDIKDIFRRSWMQLCRDNRAAMLVFVTVECTGRTGVEMEAMTGASAGMLTGYDMCKSTAKQITFDVSLLSKDGGSSGSWRHPGIAKLHRSMKNTDPAPSSEVE